jgi:hypothetical protein
MRDGGPAIANLEISGIVRRDVVTEEINEMNGFLLSGAYAQTSGVASEAQLFAAGKADLVLTNDRDLPLSIAGRFGAHEQLVAEPADFAVHLDPGESSHLSVAVRAAEATDLLELRPMVLDLAATWQPEGREAITVPSSRRLDVHGTHEGPELVENGRFEDAAQPWFTWVQAPDIGTVAFGDGEMRIGLKDPEFPWSAGMGQYVGALQPNGRYRLSFRASNSGGDGIVQCQVGIDGQTEPLWITVDGERTQGAPVQVGTEPELHTVEFVLPGDVDLSTGKLLFTLGGLREARIDDVSLREIMGEPVTVE